MRGKGSERYTIQRQYGITPAYAGKRNTQRLGASGSRDHPRVCGEKNAGCVSSGTRAGSPSHMRGKVLRLHADKAVLGITPAYAGKRFSCKSGEKQVGDHPPRMRGKEQQTVSSSAKTGITPAYAGKSPFSAVFLPLLLGSPPHMRGKEDCPPAPASLVGITPAYAGKSHHSKMELTAPRDHPRICGEKPLLLRWIRSSLGSPPHMRGKGSDPPLTLRHIGITPAYAGKRIL